MGLRRVQNRVGEVEGFGKSLKQGLGGWVPGVAVSSEPASSNSLFSSMFTTPSVESLRFREWGLGGFGSGLTPWARRCSPRLVLRVQGSGLREFGV